MEMDGFDRMEEFVPDASPGIHDVEEFLPVPHRNFTDTALHHFGVLGTEDLLDVLEIVDVSFVELPEGLQFVADAHHLRSRRRQPHCAGQARGWAKGVAEDRH